MCLKLGQSPILPNRSPVGGTRPTAPVTETATRGESTAAQAAPEAGRSQSKSAAPDLGNQELKSNGSAPPELEALLAQYPELAEVDAEALGGLLDGDISSQDAEFLAFIMENMETVLGADSPEFEAMVMGLGEAMQDGGAGLEGLRTGLSEVLNENEIELLTVGGEAPVSEPDSAEPESVELESAEGAVEPELPDAEPSEAEGPDTEGPDADSGPEEAGDEDPASSELTDDFFSELNPGGVPAQGSSADGGSPGDESPLGDDLFAEANTETGEMIGDEVPVPEVPNEAGEVGEVGDMDPEAGDIPPDPNPPSQEQLEEAASLLGIPAEELSGMRDKLREASYRLGMNVQSPDLGAMVRNLDQAILGTGKEGTQEVLGRLRALTGVIRNTRDLALNPDPRAQRVAQGLGLDKLNNALERSVNRIPNQGLQNIARRYLLPSNRSESASAMQRMKDVEDLLAVAAGEAPWDENMNRVALEMVLDNGMDAVRGIREALPERARASLDRTLEQIENKVVSRLGQEGMETLRRTIGSSSEMARHAARFLTTENPVEMIAHSIDFLGEAAKSGALGRVGTQAIAPIADFLQLDNLAQGHLNDLLDSSKPLAQRMSGLRSLATYYQGKFPNLPVDQIKSTVVDGAQRAFNATGEALSTLRTQVGSAVDEAADLGRQAVDAVNSRIDDVAQRLNISPQNAEKLKTMVRNLGPEGVENVIGMMDRVGREFADTMVAVLDNMPKSAISALASSSTASNLVADTMKASGQMLQKMKVPARALAGLAPKLAKNFMKTIPALGGAVSAYDAARLGSIALTGQDLGGRQYEDPNVRALALLGAGINTADTALAITEALGVGNVALPAQIGLAGAGLVVDIAVDYFDEHGMPPEMASTIRRGAAVAAGGSLIAAPFTGGGSLAISGALANIYGTDVLVDELKDMGREGVEALKGLAVAGGELAGEALDGLTSMGTAGAQALRDMATAGGDMAMDALKNLQDMGSAYAGYVDEAIGNIMDAGGAALDNLMEVAGDVGAIAGRVKDVIVSKLSDGWERSTIDLIPFNGVGSDLSPLEDAVAELTSMAYNAGARAAGEIMDIVRSELRELGVPAWAIDLVL